MKRRRWNPLWLIPLALVAFVVVSDLVGWSYLRWPAQSVLSAVLDREVAIGTPFRFHLRPRIPVEVGSLTIAAPEWSDAPHFVALKGLEGEVGWGALIGRQPWLPRLAVEEVDVHAQRNAEGHATWEFAKEAERKPDDEAPVLPRIERLEIGRATVALDDAPTGLKLDVVASTREGGPESGTSAEDGGFLAQGEGSWNDAPIAFDLKTPGLLKLVEGGRIEEVELKARSGETEASFNGSLAGLPALGDVIGDLTVSGRSLADLTLLPDLVLPNTPPYELEARIERAGETVKVDVGKAEIGSSSMTAQLEYDAGPTPPVLRGALNASRFVLQDLGPALGTAGDDDASSDAKKKDADEASRVLPDREFNLPRMRAMNADVRLDLRRMDLGTDALRPLSAVKGRLLLEGGRLEVKDLNATMAEGTVAGTTVLDASREGAPPRFDVRLRWNAVNLRKWLQVQEDFLVAGRFSGRTELTGTGRSTAGILASLDGAMKGRIDGGAISHQLIELAGLDVGESLGVLVSGDKPLELTCGLIDLSAKDGTVRSNLFLLDTRDTLFFLQGQVDLADERLDLRLVQSPKDWSPLSLRAPLLLRGTLGDPDVGVEATPIALKLLGSVIAGAVAPIAALVPLFEVKDNEQKRDGCGPAIKQVNKKAAELREKGKGEPGSESGAGRGEDAGRKSGEPGTRNRKGPQPADEGMPRMSPGGKDPGLDPGARPSAPQ
jgi:uncharacterized protein involved in outer membrane biogenesis